MKNEILKDTESFDFKHVMECRKQIYNVFNCDVPKDLMRQYAGFNCSEILKYLPDEVDELRFEVNDELISSTRLPSKEKDPRDMNIWFENDLKNFLDNFPSSDIGY